MSAETSSVAQAAARQLDRDSELVAVSTVGQAVQNSSVVQAEMLVLSEPDGSAVAQAQEAVDATGLPRWPVVILGGGRDDLAETVPREEWQPALVAKVFHAALRHHELACQNARLQGDLKTVARRISHDLYSPMGCISTCAQLLKTTPGMETAPPDGTIVGNIEESLAEMAYLIKRVSFLLRATADPAAATRIAMADVVAEVLDQMAAQLKTAGASVVDAGSWPEVHGVQPWLEVIWSNLVANALKHGGQRVQIRLEWTDEGEVCRFSVINQGKALAPAIEAGLFKPFDQLHLFPGSGLGLAIVQRLVALQGGRCAYARLDGGASVFSFTLPRAPAGPRR